MVCGEPDEPVPEAVRVKICGLKRREDARRAAASGADYVGVVLSPGFPRSVPMGRAQAVVAGVGATPVAVLVDPSEEEAVACARALGAGVVQLHGSEPTSLAEAVRSQGPWSVWKAIKVRDPVTARRELTRWEGHADGFLLEGWSAEAGGGVGASLDLGAAEEALGQVRRIGAVVIVAGGLTPGNVARVIGRLQPDIVDVSSGVERGVKGVKDAGLMRRFIEEARRASLGLEARG